MLGKKVNILVLTLLTLLSATSFADTQYSATVCDGSKYLFGCTPIAPADGSGTYIDGSVHLNLTFGSPKATAYTATIEPGQTYLFGCQKLSVDGEVASNTLTQAGCGCDSTVTLTLKVQAAVLDTVKMQYSAEINEGEKYLFGCRVLEEAGTYADTLAGVGRDSVIVLHLTKAAAPVLDTVKMQYSAEINEGEIYLFGCKQFTADTTYADTIHLAGKDSITVLTLTVEPACPATPVVGDTTAIVCEGDLPFLWHGMSLSSDTTNCDDTLRAVIDNKCDSIVRLTLIIKATSTFEDYASICPSELPYTWHGITFDEAKDSIFTLTNAVGCDSVVTLHLTVFKPDTTVLPAVDSCNRYHLMTADIDTLITTTGNYRFVLQNANGCDSIVKINVTIATPYVDTLSLIHKFGDRLLMINRKEINAMPGWYLDSLDIDHPEYVSWYEIDPAGNEKPLHDGYTHSLPNGEPLPAGYTYYAEVNIPAVGGNCGAIGKTERYTIPSAAPAPALMPSLARPGEEIRIVNLDPGTQTVVRIYSADGIMHGRYTVQGVESYTIKAAGTTGFYMVELTNESLQSTLRYIVK